MKNTEKLNYILYCLIFVCSMTSCSKTSPGNNNAGGTDTIPVTPPPSFDINSINDTYDAVAPFTFYQKWGSYNVHDPSIKKFGDYYYCFSTDVGYGISVR